MTITLGQRIYQLRRGSGLSQEDLAESLNVSRQSVSKWETDGSVPDLDKLIALSELFGVSLDDLVKGDVIVKPAPTFESAETEAPTTEPAETEAPASESLTIDPPAKDTPRADTGRETVPQPEKFWCARRIVGVVLLIAAVFCAFFLLLFSAEVLYVILGTSPLWVCGVICLTVRRHPVVFCLWGIAVSVSTFLAAESVFSFYNFDLINTWYTFLRIDGLYPSGAIELNPVYVAVKTVISCLVIALMVLTVTICGKDRIRADGRTLLRYGLIAGGFLLLDIVLQCVNMEISAALYGSESCSLDIYCMSDLRSILTNLRICMRSIAVTAAVSVIVSLVREKVTNSEKN